MAEPSAIEEVDEAVDVIMRVDPGLRLTDAILQIFATRPGLASRYRIELARLGRTVHGQQRLSEVLSRMRRVGTLHAEVTPDRAAVIAIDQAVGDDEFLRHLGERRQELINAGLSPTQATMRIFTDDRAAWQRYRAICTATGTRLVALEGV